MRACFYCPNLLLQVLLFHSAHFCPLQAELLVALDQDAPSCEENLIWLKNKHEKTEGEPGNGWQTLPECKEELEELFQSKSLAFLSRGGLGVKQAC